MPFSNKPLSITELCSIWSAQEFAEQRRAELEAAPPSNAATPDEAIAAIVAGLAHLDRKAA